MISYFLNRIHSLNTKTCYLKKHTAVQSLLQKYKEGNCSIEESVLLQQSLEKIVAQERKRESVNRMMPWLHRGAAILLACISGAWYYQHTRMTALPIGAQAILPDSSVQYFESGGKSWGQPHKMTPQTKYTLFLGEQ